MNILIKMSLKILFKDICVFVPWWLRIIQIKHIEYHILIIRNVNIA
jgi:hypothetical protein